jgi:FOG: HEAT repeat
LRQLGPAAKAAIPALIETLNDREPPVRVEASLALAAIGTEAVPALIKAVQGTNPFLQMGARWHSATWARQQPTPSRRSPRY